MVSSNGGIQLILLRILYIFLTTLENIFIEQATPSRAAASMTKKQQFYNMIVNLHEANFDEN